MGGRFRHVFRAFIILVVAGLLAVSGGSAQAATVPAGFTERILTTGLSAPTAMAVAPDGRIFVAQQAGALRVIKGGVLLSTPFVSLPVDPTGERGLIGVALDPNFATNGYVYVHYTSPTPAPHNRVSRLTANGDVAQAGSEVVLFDLPNLSGATNHNGGAIHFGVDGKLYVAVGENANPANSQTLSNPLGKILRFNADGTIPSDNPFFNTTTGLNRSIWALGLRNPFTFAIQPGTGRMFINDVGAGSWEEINEGLAGANYGWPQTEGYTSDPRFVSPLYAYSHTPTPGPETGCAIVGGAFYNPARPQFPQYLGDYFFGDLCSGWVRRLDTSSNTVSPFATGLSSPVDLTLSSGGGLYYLARGSSTLGEFRYGVRSIADFDNDRDTDRSVFRDGAWHAQGQGVVYFGLSGDVPVAGDYDGDGDAGRAVYREGAWLVEGQPTVFFGLADDIPVPADYDGDGDTDRAVYRDGAWLVEGQATVFLGLDSDVAVPGDYDGDGDADRAVWRPANGGWFVHGQAATFLGLSGDIPAPADYDGDRRTDRGVWRSSVGGWYIDNQSTVYLGLGGDAPVPGDYDGDGDADRAVWRPSFGGWYVEGQTTVYLGLSGDYPVPMPASIALGVSTG